MTTQDFDISGFDTSKIKAWMEQARASNTVTIRDTTFTIHKLLPMEGYRVWEPLRVELFDRASRAAISLDTSSVAAIVGIILSVSEPVLERVRVKMFEQVFFRNQTAQTEMTLTGNEAMAFQNLEVIHVYEIIVKCLAVNFTPSLLELLSLMDRVLPSSPPPPTAI